MGSEEFFVLGQLAVDSPIDFIVIPPSPPEPFPLLRIRAPSGNHARPRQFPADLIPQRDRDEKHGRRNPGGLVEHSLLNQRMNQRIEPGQFVRIAEDLRSQRTTVQRAIFPQHFISEMFVDGLISRSAWLIEGMGDLIGVQAICAQLCKGVQHSAFPRANASGNDN